MKSYPYIFIIILLTGCTLINKPTQPPGIQAGIDRKQAVVIGQKQLADSEHASEYSRFLPRVITDIFTEEHPDYWFISFANRDYDRSFWHYLVVVNKANGVVKYAGPFTEYRAGDYDWVFEAK